MLLQSHLQWNYEIPVMSLFYISF